MDSTVIERKLEAARRFVARLLASPAGSYVAKVVLHGSVAEGTAEPESDVDLLVFQTDGHDLVADACDEASFEVLLETAGSVEPLIFPLSAYRHPPSYFVYCGVRYGRELYSMSEEELKRE